MAPLRLSIVRDFTGLVRQRFIETGTGDGDTVIAASRAGFGWAHSIEVHLPTHVAALAAATRAGARGLTLHHGDSREVLPVIIEPERSTTFWLDAHFSGEVMPADADWLGPQCPLLGELSVIASTPWVSKPLVLIDDAHMFCDDEWWQTDEALAFRRDDWPTLGEITQALPGWRVVRRGGYLVAR